MVHRLRFLRLKTSLAVVSDLSHLILQKGSSESQTNQITRRECFSEKVRLCPQKEDCCLVYLTDDTKEYTQSVKFNVSFF